MSSSVLAPCSLNSGLYAKQFSTVLREKLKISIRRMNGSAPVVSRKVLVKDPRESKRQPGSNIFVRWLIRSNDERCFALIVLFVELFRIPIAHNQPFRVSSTVPPLSMEGKP